MIQKPYKNDIHIYIYINIIGAVQWMLKLVWCDDDHDNYDDDGHDEDKDCYAEDGYDDDDDGDSLCKLYYDSLFHVES
jgi:hypothetical protein